MAIIKAVSLKANISNAIDYITKEEKTEGKLISSKDCNVETAKEEMQITKDIFEKTEGRQYKHYVQSFNPEDNVSPEIAHEIGKKFIEHKKFEGYEIVMATHIDKDHIHNHFIVNSVNFETGTKYHETKKELELLKEYSNELSKTYNLSVPEKGEKITSYNMKKYKALEKAITSESNYKSYVLNCYKAVSEVKEQAINREDFVAKMKDKGYETNWSDNRKHITFIDIEGNKVRNTKIEKEFKDLLGKEELEHGFKINFKRTITERKAEEQLNPGTDRKAESEDRAAANRDIGSFINKLNTDERVKEEKRKDREANRERFRTETQQRNVREEREKATRKPKATDYSREFER